MAKHTLKKIKERFNPNAQEKDISMPKLLSKVYGANQIEVHNATSLLDTNPKDAIACFYSEKELEEWENSLAYNVYFFEIAGEQEEWQARQSKKGS